MTQSRRMLVLRAVVEDPKQLQEYHRDFLPEKESTICDYILYFLSLCNVI